MEWCGGILNTYGKHEVRAIGGSFLEYITQWSVYASDKRSGKYTYFRELANRLPAKK